MRRFALLFLLGLSCGTPQAAEAGRIYLQAESTRLTITPASLCSHQTVSMSDQAVYTVTACGNGLPDVPGWTFVTNAVYPAGAQPAWTYRIHYEGLASPGTQRCEWLVQASVVPSGIHGVATTGAPVAVVGGDFVTGTGGQRQITAVSAPASVWNLLTGAVCVNAAACENLDLRFNLELNTEGGASDASACYFRMLEVIY